MKNDSNKTFSKENIEWAREHEIILAEWADKAICFRWLHAKSHMNYSYANTWFTIPVIVMSTITGTANFAQDRFPTNIKDYATMGIGAVNIFAGILTTIQQFLKISELNEAHRVSSISWGKFYRNVKVELSKAPLERISVSHMLKISKEEYDRLMETSPTIPEKIIKQFNKTFNTKLKNQNTPFILKKPEICDNIEPTMLSIYKPPQDNNSVLEDEPLDNIIIKFKNEMKRMPSVNELKSETDNNMTEIEINDILTKHLEKTV
tara:strand:+ start:4972 stop:5760 length:789 start_codon:yes stop_codon:yes gene_type:complete